MEYLTNHTWKQLDPAQEGARIHEAKRVFLDNPLAPGAVDRVIDLEYAQYLKYPTEIDEEMAYLAFMIGVTTHYYFLFKHSDKELINTKLM
jgi:hypothetical protein